MENYFLTLEFRYLEFLFTNEFRIELKYEYSVYFFSQIPYLRILQFRVCYYVQPNTLEYSAEYSKQNDSIFRCIR